MAKKIKYVGVKEGGETAFFHETGGITWYPGDSHTIQNDSLASRMLQHPDVFAEDGVEVQAGNSSDADDKPKKVVAKDDPLASLEDDQVRALVKKEGLQIKGLNLLKGDNLRLKVRAALDARAAEQ